jgi:hypothetical protein
VLLPLLCVWLWVERCLVSYTSFTCLLRTFLMLCAEMQTTSGISTKGLGTTTISDPSVNLSIAFRMIANCRNTIANIPVPVAVVPYRPSHEVSFQEHRTLSPGVDSFHVRRRYKIQGRLPGESFPVWVVFIICMTELDVSHLGFAMTTTCVRDTRKRADASVVSLCCAWKITMTTYWLTQSVFHPVVLS